MLLDRLKNDGKPELKLNTLQLAMKAQVEQKVNDKIFQFEEIVCPVCSNKEMEVIGEKDRYGLFFKTNICTNCGMVCTNPRMNQAAYNDFYNTEYRKLYVGEEKATGSFFDKQVKKGANIYNFLDEKNLLKEELFVLEVGTGAGGIIQYFKDKGHRVKGLDLGAEYVEYGKNTHGLDLEVATLANLSLDEKPDVIIYSHILEHILDVNEEIELIRKWSKPDTLIYIEVPGIKEVHLNYEMNILKYFQNAHTFHFTLESLTNLMNKNGFELIHGNQFVKSVFKLSNQTQKPYQSDFKAVKTYILETEKNRWKFNFSKYGIKLNATRWILNTMDKTNTRSFFKKIKDAIT